MSSTSPPASSERRRSSGSKSPSSTPSLFSNQYSRGPLYQYWRERNRESVETRDRRILDAKERSQGRQPQYPEPGPSSNSEYANRLERGLRTPATPAYEEQPSSAAAGAPVSPPANVEEELPSYGDVTETNANQPPPADGMISPFATSTGDEKARLQAHYEQQQQQQQEAERANSTADDAAIAAAMQNEEQQQEGQGKGKEPARKKSVGARVGNFLGAAFTGYNMKSDGKGNVNRW